MLIQSNTTNIYYTLKQLETLNLSTLTYRQLKNRIKDLVISNTISLQLLYKDANVWHIHYSIVNKLQANRVHNKSKERANMYKNEVTINLGANYNIEYYKYLATSIAKALKGSKTIYSVETSKTNDSNYHLHLGTTAPIHAITKKLKDIESTFKLTILYNVNTKIAPIRNLTQFVNYISKQSVTNISV